MAVNRLHFRSAKRKEAHGSHDRLTALNGETSGYCARNRIIQYGDSERNENEYQLWYSRLYI